MTDAAERDQGVTGDDCWICNPPDPGPCPEHGEACGGVRGCKACVREAFAEWLAFVGVRRICDGSGGRVDRTRFIACPGCAACCTSAIACPAFWDEHGPAGCVFCGGEQGDHRPMPPLPEEPARPDGISGFRIIDAGGAELGTISDILRDPR